MKRNIKNILSKSNKRQYVYVLTLIIFFASIFVLFFWFYNKQEYKEQLVEDSISFEDVSVKRILPSGIFASSSLPVSLEIPSIDISVPFEKSVGLDKNGAVLPPKSYDKVAWYKNGPTPGEIGPAVVFGHVDTKKGPAVFYSLGQLSVGDEIKIKREDGSVVVFVVIGYERVMQKDFPTDKVYGNINYAGLRLVTCTGIYNKSTKRYSHNLIVYGKLVNILNVATTTSADIK